MRISDWSSDVCSSDLLKAVKLRHAHVQKDAARLGMRDLLQEGRAGFIGDDAVSRSLENKARRSAQRFLIVHQMHDPLTAHRPPTPPPPPGTNERTSRHRSGVPAITARHWPRSSRTEAHTFELQSLMRISSAPSRL